MEFASLPVLQIILVLLILIGTAWGHKIGRKKGVESQAIVIKEQQDEQAQLVHNLKTDYEDKLNVLKKANANEVEKINANHIQQLAQLDEQQQKSLESIKSGYLEETEQLNNKHGELIQQLNQANIQKINEIQKEHDKHVDKVIAKSEEIVETINKNHQSEIEQTTSKNAELQNSITEQKKELFDLKHKVEQNQQNNMHSLSKSGDKLIRVVRSVQELANELDETSKMVTGGEYSFFEEIQDQRDRDTVLSLTQPQKTEQKKQVSKEEPVTEEGK